MKVLKSLVITLAVLLTASFSNVAQASGTAVVDLEKLLASYQVAQNVSAEMKVQEAELQKFLADAQKQLQNAKTPVDKKNLEAKLSQQFQVKSDAYRNVQMQKWKEIENNILNSISVVSKARNYDIVLKKSSVIIGGSDITDEVTAALNTAVTAPVGIPVKKK
jgi:outer membrane protein